MRRVVPDRHVPMPVTVDGNPAVFWYLIAPAEPEAGAGYDAPCMESCYVTTKTGERIEVSDEEIERLTDLAFNNKEEP